MAQSLPCSCLSLSLHENLWECRLRSKAEVTHLPSDIPRSYSYNVLYHDPARTPSRHIPVHIKQSFAGSWKHPALGLCHMTCLRSHWVPYQWFCLSEFSCVPWINHVVLCLSLPSHPPQTCDMLYHLSLYLYQHFFLPSTRSGCKYATSSPHLAWPHPFAVPSSCLLAVCHGCILF